MFVIRRNIEKHTLELKGRRFGLVLNLGRGFIQGRAASVDHSSRDCMLHRSIGELRECCSLIAKADLKILTSQSGQPVEVESSCKHKSSNIKLRNYIFLTKDFTQNEN